MYWIDTLDSDLMFIDPYLLSADYVLKSNPSLQTQQTTLNSYQWEHMLYKHKEKSWLFESSSVLWILTVVVWILQLKKK